MSETPVPEPAYLEDAAEQLRKARGDNDRHRALAWEVHAMSKNNSETLFSACVHGMQPGAVETYRDETGLWIYLDPGKRASIRIDLRPGYDDWEQSRQGLEELATAALAVAQQITELQAAQVTEAGDG